MNVYLAEINQNTIKNIFPPAQKINTIGGIVGFLVPLAIVAASGVLLIMLIWGTLNILTAGGDPEKFKKGQQTLTYSIFGFIVIFVSVLVVRIITTILQVKQNLPF